MPETLSPTTTRIASMKTPLEMWIERLAKEAATVQIVGACHAPGTPYHGSLIGVTSNGATVPFWGCKTVQQVEAEQQDRRARYAYKSAKL
jgi:hypothetical protein